MILLYWFQRFRSKNVVWLKVVLLDHVQAYWYPFSIQALEEKKSFA